MRSSFRKAGHAQAILQHTLRLESGRNVARIRHRFATLGGVAQVSQMAFATSQNDPRFQCSTFVRKCDTLATPLRRPCDTLCDTPNFDYSSTPTTLIKELMFFATPKSHFLSATQKNKYCINRGRKFELWQE